MPHKLPPWPCPAYITLLQAGKARKMQDGMAPGSNNTPEQRLGGQARILRPRAQLGGIAATAKAAAQPRSCRRAWHQLYQLRGALQLRQATATPGARRCVDSKNKILPCITLTFTLTRGELSRDARSAPWCRAPRRRPAGRAARGARPRRAPAAARPAPAAAAARAPRTAALRGFGPGPAAAPAPPRPGRPAPHPCPPPQPGCPCPAATA